MHRTEVLLINREVLELTGVDWGVEGVKALAKEIRGSVQVENIKGKQTWVTGQEIRKSRAESKFGWVDLRSTRRVRSFNFTSELIF